MPESEALHASHRLEYPYSRSVGPVIGAFLTGLREGRLLGVRGAGGIGHRASHRVRPDHRRGHRRDGRGRPGRCGRVVGVGLPSAAQAPAGPRRSPGRSSAWTAPTPPCSTSSTSAVPTGWPRGDRVTVRFRPAAERIGAMADIESFVPVGGTA